MITLEEFMFVKQRNDLHFGADELFSVTLNGVEFAVVPGFDARYFINHAGDVITLYYNSTLIHHKTRQVDDEGREFTEFSIDKTYYRYLVTDVIDASFSGALLKQTKVPDGRYTNHGPKPALPDSGNRGKDWCKRGHSLLDPANVYLNPTRSVRQCKTCKAYSDENRKRNKK